MTFPRGCISPLCFNGLRSAYITFAAELYQSVLGLVAVWKSFNSLPTVIK